MSCSILLPNYYVTIIVLSKKENDNNINYNFLQEFQTEYQLKVGY
jgi:hypothetical protein